MTKHREKAVEKTLTETLLGFGYKRDELRAAKQFAAGMYGAVLTYSFGRFRIIYGNLKNTHSFDKEWIYTSEALALDALNHWDGTGPPRGAAMGPKE